MNRRDFDGANKELDRLESSYRLADPATAKTETQKIIEEELRAAGLKPARSVDSVDESLRRRIFDAAAKFRASRPETHPNGFLACEANEQAMFDYMQANNLDFTDAGAYEQAFQKVHGKLIPPLARQCAAQRVRTVNIGGREFEISHAALEKLSARELELLLRHPEACAAIDALAPRR